VRAGQNTSAVGNGEEWSAVVTRVSEAEGTGEAINAELPEPISDQERKILSLIAEGKTNREIAERIYLSEKTVRNYVSNILGKLNLSNRAHAAAFAVRYGIASPRRH